MKALIALLVISFVALGASADFSSEQPAEFTTFGTDGVVATYGSVYNCMGLDYDPTNDMLWQTSENSGETITIDPYTGTYTSRWNISSYISGMNGNGVYFDDANDYLYIADYNGDGGATYSDAIYCFHVDTPDSPTLIDTWNLGTLNGILGITYKAPYFYMTYYGSTMKAFTLNPGGTFVDEGTYSQSGMGDIFYDAAWNVFYTHAGVGATVYVLDGDDPNTTLDSFSPGCTVADGICPGPVAAELWTSDFNTQSNHVIDDEYVPPALERSTWGNIKTLF